MTLPRALAATDHRPWPLPTGPWVMAQTWHDLLFAHWPIPAASLRRAIPPALAIDTFDGDAWIGVVPFRMTGVRLRWTPALPWISAFPELNVRTYVSAGGRAGIFFLSLDAGNLVAVAAARRWFYLRYYHARMSVVGDGDRVRYRSRRVHRRAPPAAFAGSYRPAGATFRARAATLDHWLIERYCLYAQSPAGRLYRAEIHHAPWPLQSAEAEIERNTMTLPHGATLPPTAPLLHFARRMDVVVWPLRLLT